MPTTTPNKALVIIKTGALGDVVRTTCFLTGLKKKFPLSTLHWITSPAAFPLLRNLPQINHLHTPDKLPNLPPGSAALVLSLEEEPALARFASSLHADQLHGVYWLDPAPAYTDSLAGWYDMSLISKFGRANADQLKQLNRLTYQELIAKPLGIEPTPPLLPDYPPFTRQSLLTAITQPAATLSERAATVSERSDQQTILLGLSPGSGSRWVSKRIPLDSVKHLLQQLAVDLPHVLPLMLWGPDESELIRDLAPLRNLFCDLGNNLSLEEYMSLVSSCDYLITADSLTLHLGLGYGVPVLAVFRTTPAAEIKMFDRGMRIATSDPRYASMHPTQNLTLGLEPQVLYAAVISLLRQFSPGRNR